MMAVGNTATRHYRQMATSYNFLHRRSLTLSFVSLVFGGVAFAFLFEFDQRLSESFLSWAAVVASLGLIVCVLTLIDLVRDVGRDSRQLCIRVHPWLKASFTSLIPARLASRRLAWTPAIESPKRSTPPDRPAGNAAMETAFGARAWCWPAR